MSNDNSNLQLVSPGYQALFGALPCVYSPQQPYHVGCVIFPILQTKGLWLREGKQLAWGSHSRLVELSGFKSRQCGVKVTAFIVKEFFFRYS